MKLAEERLNKIEEQIEEEEVIPPSEARFFVER